MARKSNMSIIFWDGAIDTVFIENTMLGPNLRVMERMPRDEEAFGKIADMLRATEHTPARVTLCLPRNATMQRTLRYPALVRDDIENMIQFEASRHVPLAEEDRALGYIDVVSADEKQLVVDLQAARQSEIRKLIDAFAEVDVPIDEAVSFSSLIAPTVADAPTLLVIADEKSVELCLYGEGIQQDNQLISRSAPGFSDERIITATRQMAAQNREWLGDEGIGRVLLAGPAEISGSFGDDLGTAFGLHARQIDVPSDIEALCAETGNEPLREALLAVSVEAPPTFNLIEDQKRKVPLSKRTVIITALCALLAVELVGALALKTYAPVKQRKEVAREIARMKKKTAPIQEMKEQNRALRDELVRLDDMCKTRVSSMEIMRVLTETFPEDSYMRYIIYRRAHSLRIKGMSKDPNTLPALVQAMPFVKGIDKSDIDKKVDEYHEFTLYLALRSPDDEENDS